jgi:protein-L-isoaspartate(D-aspartate) O-methyltransferase
MTSLADARRAFAESLRTSKNLRSDALVRAVATVPREAFLGPGPWFLRSMEQPAGAWTEDADPRHLIQDASVAVDVARQLYNGTPGGVVQWFDALAIAPGERVLHIGCGTGYYSAVLAELTGPEGAVFAEEIDESLAARARTNLAPWPWVTVRTGGGRRDLPAGLDAIVVHAGAPQIFDEWRDALRDGGRMIVSLTTTFPGMPPTLGKGMTHLVTRRGDELASQPLSIVMIYNLQPVED